MAKRFLREYTRDENRVEDPANVVPMSKWLDSDDLNELIGVADGEIAVYRDYQYGCLTIM